jgi:uncharacterized protein YndB with AHSA1/START domain
MTLDHVLHRELLIRARRETVFGFLSQTARFAAWWGAGSEIEPRPGGQLRIRFPNAVQVSGQVLECVEGERLVFTYGYDAPEKPIPPGGSRVTVALADDPHGTRVWLRHECADAAARDAHVPGWRYQLAVLANAAADSEQSGLTHKVDAFFAAWNEGDATRRRALLDEALAPDVSFRDRHGCVSGLDDLDAYLAGVQAFFPGVRLERGGPVSHCQGTALAPWRLCGPGGEERGHGHNVFELAPGGRIAAVTGLWAPQPAR